MYQVRFIFILCVLHNTVYHFIIIVLLFYIDFFVILYKVYSDNRHIHFIKHFVNCQLRDN